MKNKRRAPKPSQMLSKKAGPTAWIAEGKIKSIGRHYWVVLSGFSFQQFSRPATAKAAWRKINADGWQKKVGNAHQGVEVA